MKRRFESGKGDRDGPPPKRKGRIDMPHVLKFLCPEVLASAIIGKGGEVIKKIREQTGTRLGLSDHHELYPGTDDRVLTCQGNTEESLMDVAVQIISRVSECVEEGRSEALGEPGQLKLKTLMPKAAVGGIIGKGGSSIKALRDASGCKISIAEPIGGGPGAEQIVTLSGDSQALEVAMNEINKQVQAVNQEPWWQDWAQGDDIMDGGRGPPKGGKGGKGDNGGGKGKGRKSKDWDDDWEVGGRDTRPRGGGFRGEHPGVQLMVDTARNLPAYVLDDERGFALSCIVPNRLVGGLIGRGGSGTKEIQSMTDTKIRITEIPDDPENRTLNIAGPIGNACSAYMLMMKRYLDAEAGR